MKKARVKRPLHRGPSLAEKRRLRKREKPFDYVRFFDDRDWDDMEVNIGELEPIENLLFSMRDQGLLSEDTYPDEALADVLNLAREITREGLRRMEEEP